MTQVRKLLLNALGFIVAAALVTGCVQTQERAIAPDLVGAQWMRIDDENASPHFPTLAFDETGASGYSGCGPWSAQVRPRRDGLAFVAIRLTYACQAAPARAAEASFMTALRGTRALRRDGEELILLDRAGRTVARFIRAD